MDEIQAINYADVRAELLTLTGVADEEGADDQLEQAYKLASGYLYSLVAGEEVDTVKFEALSRIALIESAVYRFNRLSEEGMSSRTQDGESITWEADPLSKWEDKIKDTIKNKVKHWKLIMASTRDDTNTRMDLGYRVPLLANGTWYYTNILGGG
ncbi:phage head-tail connector protein [Candidatus Enterococcus clewellii]|uniref:Uncharacterized protein n=1 Tax=Candidatus Enterococcus clewellii TaxID=1834193 RepID=A0A242K8T7_9ENTE|nr:phage head-tail connector protein [Enterococcus sp. 9E7_DIV0242]OTP17584.1 hypothetical protein A5888_001722 [Enterococcus sp. 9E7_DIV0242]